MSDDEEDRLMALLESQHTFPGPYAFKVICRNAPGAPESIVAGILARTGLAVVLPDDGMKASRTGKYVSMTLRLEANLAQDVLDVYACLRSFGSVIQYF